MNVEWGKGEMVERDDDWQVYERRGSKRGHDIPTLLLAAALFGASPIS